MNRLVIVGNGYDLAAGMKTSYEDFLVDYFKEALMTLKEGYDNYTDQLIEIQYRSRNLNQDILKSKVDKIVSIDTLLNAHFLEFDNKKKARFSGSIPKIDPDKIELLIKSELLQKLLIKKNWSDIESFYFNELIKIFNEAQRPQMRLRIGSDVEEVDEESVAIKKLNKEFTEIKNKLAEYIGRVSESINNNNIGEPMSCFKRIIEPLQEENFLRFFNNDKASSTDKELKNVFVVNFNYTSNFNSHFFKELSNQENIRVANIHGYYENPDEIIFGYGDDSHPLYARLEASGNDEYLKFIKSFHYPHNKSYIELMNLIESDQFEVQVIGHSLGLSDRVLLKSIFEHENCKMIKLLHRGNKKDMIHKYMALSRHCSDKAAMRRKILEYDAKDVVNEELVKN